MKGLFESYLGTAAKREGGGILKAQNRRGARKKKGAVVVIFSVRYMADFKQIQCPVELNLAWTG